MTTYYKILGNGHKAIHGGTFTYVPGEWTPEIEDVTACVSGYHVASREQVANWLYAYDDQLPVEVWECSVRGARKVGNKSVCASIRIDRCIATLNEWDLRWVATEFAVYASRYTDNERMFDAINMIRRACVKRGQTKWLNTAWNAARIAEWSAAQSAAQSAAWSAVRSAAAGALESAAQSAAWSAARRAAGGAAWNATWNAACNAAEVAEWNAAWDVAWNKLTDVLFEYLEG